MPAAEEATAMPRTEIHPVAAADRGVALHNVLAAGDAARAVVRQAPSP